MFSVFFSRMCHDLTSLNRLALGKFEENFIFPRLYHDLSQHATIFAGEMRTAVYERTERTKGFVIAKIWCSRKKALPLQRN